MGFSSLLAIQRGQPYPPLGTRGHPTLLTLQNLPSTALVSSLSSRLQPSYGPKRYAVPSTLGYKFMC